MTPMYDVHGRPHTAPPTPEQLAAVERFKARHGRNWRSALLDCWAQGTEHKYREDSHLLRQLRNQQGPRWVRGLPND